MQTSDPLDQIILIAQKNAAQRGLTILHPQYVIEAILLQGMMNAKLRGIGISSQELLTCLQCDLGIEQSETTHDQIILEDREFVAFMRAAEEKAEDNGYMRVTTFCAFAAALSITSGSTARIFAQFGLTEEKLDGMIMPAEKVLALV